MSKEFTVWDECKRLQRKLALIDAREMKLTERLAALRAERMKLGNGASLEALGILRLRGDGTPEK